MRKVLVIGSGGAGKSTLAVRLGKVLGLPVVHLDRLHWKPGWVEPDKTEWRETVIDLVAGDEWVMDGNYGGTLDLRIPVADTIVFMDFPPAICLWRVVKRRFVYRGGSRPDMAPGCTERLDLGFLGWVWSYRKNRRPRILKQIELHGRDKPLFTLRGPKDAADFLSTLASQAGPQQTGV